MWSRVEHKALNQDKIETLLDVDGASLPILELRIFHGDKCRGWVMLDKEQVEELTRDLQRKLAEM